MAFSPERRYTSPGMKFMRSSRVIPPSVRRAAMLFIAAAQVLLAFAPVTEGRLGADARSHVEAAGTNTHHAHDAGDCTACAARGLVAPGSQGAQSSLPLNESSALIPSARHGDANSALQSSSRPRAPPVRLA